MRTYSPNLPIQTIGIINHQVLEGTITKCCFDCANKYKTKEPYDETVTMRQAHCDICNELKQVGSASKLFGYHRFL